MKITELAELNSVDPVQDVVAIVDATDATTKKALVKDLLGANLRTLFPTEGEAATSDLNFKANFKIVSFDSHTAHTPTGHNGYGICLTYGSDKTGWHIQFAVDTSGNAWLRTITNWGASFTGWSKITTTA